jgi:protein disulfide-isomerase
MHEMNKKAWFAALFVTLSLLPLEGLTQEPVHWEPTLDSALRLAGHSNRLVVIHFWAPWCTYCKRLEAEVLTSPDVIAELNANYVPVKINADYFPATAKQYGVTALPTTAIVSPQGQLIESIRGWVKPSDYVVVLHNVALRAKPAGALYAQIPAGAPAAKPLSPAPAATPAAADQSGAGGALAPSGATAATGRQPAAAPVQPAYGSQAAGAGQPAPALVSPGYAPPSLQEFTPGPGWRPPADTTQQTAPPGAGTPAAAGSGYGTLASAPPPATPGAQTTGLASATPSSPPASSAVATIPAGNPPLGLDGYCPVSLAEKFRWVPGDRRWGVIHRGRTYLFAGPDEQRRFLRDPDCYAPLFSGNDIVLAVDLGRIVPGMRQHGLFLTPGGHVFLFSSEETLAKFMKDPKRYGEQAMAFLRAGMNPGAPLR